MSEQCNECNGTGEVRDGYDGVAPCPVCRPDDHLGYVYDQLRQTEEMLKVYRSKVETLTVEVERLREAQRWIRSCDRMPDKPGCYLWFTTMGNQPVVNFYDPDWNTVGATTHWMPLPEPPAPEVKP